MNNVQVDAMMKKAETVSKTAASWAKLMCDLADHERRLKEENEKVDPKKKDYLQKRLNLKSLIRSKEGFQTVRDSENPQNLVSTHARQAVKSLKEFMDSSEGITTIKSEIETIKKKLLTMEKQLNAEFMKLMDDLPDLGTNEADGPTTICPVCDVEMHEIPVGVESACFNCCSVIKREDGSYNGQAIVVTVGDESKSKVHKAAV